MILATIPGLVALASVMETANRRAAGARLCTAIPRAARSRAERTEGFPALQPLWHNPGVSSPSKKGN